MIFLFVSIIVPAFIFIFYPLIIERLSKKQAKQNTLLLVTCFLYFVSWFLPSPLIEGRDTSFTTHVVGGGIFSGMLWLYTKQMLRLNSSWVIELLSLFAFVSALGVVNELFELIIFQLHLTSRLKITDTSWDLLANTLGVLLFWVIYRLSAKQS